MKKYYKFLFISLLTLLWSVEIKAQAFFDDFTSATVNTAEWNIANQVWGNVAGRRSNGGVVPQNVRITNGNLVIEAHGNQYTGPVAGHGQNTRVGGAIYTKRQFASGSYEVRAKIVPNAGALSAFWTYYYENDNYNHEIDFEMPGRNQPPNSPATSSLDYGLATSWRGVGAAQHKVNDVYFGNQVDGNYHLYRFEWHTGGNGQAARVEWYYDNRLVATNTDPAVIPNHISNFWVGVWFPWWIAEPNFNTLYMYVDWVRITPFNEPNDFPAPVCSTAPNMPGLVVGNTTVAAGSTQTYYVDNVPGATSYVWTLPSGWTGTSTTSAITAGVGNAGGTISVRSRNSCGTSAARTFNVTVGSCTAPPQPGLIVGNTTVASGTNQTYYVDNVPGATSYTWTLPSGWTGTSTTNAITARVGTTGGAISVRSNNSCGTSTTRSITVTVNGASNLALGKPAFASSNETSTLTPNQAVDGSLTTRWASQYTHAQWIYVDLGATYNVNRVKINWEAAYGRDYQIQISSNATTWTNMASIVGNTSLERDHTGLAGTGRYVRINGTLRGTQYGYSIFELQVFGSSARLAINELTTGEEESLTIYPNPSNSSTQIKYQVSENEKVTLEIFDINGVKVQTLLRRKSRKAGSYTESFEALNPGTYVIRLSVGSKVFNKHLYKQ